MNKSQEIQSIIGQRQPLAKKLTDIETGLSSLYASLQRLEQERDRQLPQWSGDEATESQLQKLDFASFEQKIREQLGSLRRLQGRFSRKTLNIGVIGRMGQGKSTLLQSLTGLKNEVIPALSGKACTAARSTICHQQGNLTTAEIQFHDHDSFLREVIIPYYKKLGLMPIPSSLEAFVHGEIPSLPLSANQTNINIYNRLKDDYHTNGKKYQEYLRRGSLNIQDPSKISNYVAQEYKDSQLINHECLAVKHVKISCEFPFDEIGAIALVDVPGLGDFRLGDESLVIEALAQEVDFILFICKPSKDRANFEQSDTDLYHLANKALNDLPSRSIFVLNVDRNGENQKNCHSLKRDIDSETVKMPVLDLVIADCSSPEEANNKVLQAVLDNLRSNVTQLDRNYTQQKITDLQASLTELKQQLQLAQGILPHIDIYEIEAQYDDLFDEFWSRITSKMTDLLQQDLIKTRQNPDENLKSQIETVLQDCRKNMDMPSIEEVEERNKTLESYASTYSEYLKELRTNLSRKFLDMDKGLKKTIEGTKAKVADVLVEKCDLGGLATVRGADFLADVASQIPSEYTELKKGFDILSEFNLSYRGLIQHRIRLQLDTLTPNKTALLEQKGANAQGILENLKELYQETLYNCENALNGFLSEPSQASFAIVEEFADRVLRAKSARKEWKRFLAPKRGQIWGDFENLQKQMDASQEWSRLLGSVSGRIDDLEGSLKNL
ncbi:dynamin family protein [Planktothrix agardhii]|uniref:dynamin family protein n=1 Tax=Planktothrix agardhii TaxID=1160 RepID=UPI00040BA6F3|nr:dynamin family protein [Planktothrix agardhii]